MSELRTLPLWKGCLEKMRAAGMTFGSFWPVEFFEEELSAKQGSNEFTFALLALREAIKHGPEGFFLTQEQNGQIYRIKEAVEMVDHARNNDAQAVATMRYSIHCRRAVLANPQARLDDTHKQRLERDLEKATVRLLLCTRQKSVEKIIMQKQPKLLKKG